MLKVKNLFRKEKIKVTPTNLTKPDLHTHRKAPLEAFKSIKLAEDAISATDQMIKEYGSRLTGSESCRNCANKIKEKLNEFCDYTETQSFTHKGDSYSFWLKGLPIVYIVTIFLLLIGFSIIPLLINIGFLYYIYKNFIIYDPILEKPIKSQVGNNIFGIINPNNEVKQTIIFSAHHDSARLANKNRGDHGYFINVELPLILFSISIIINIVEVFVELFTGKVFSIGLPQLSTMIILILLLTATPIVLKLRNFYSDKASPGAGDNLISSNILVQLSKYYDWAKKNGKGLNNTRVIFTSFDAEEVGIRGSKEWFKKNQDLLLNATQLNFDCIYKAKDLVFLDSDKNGLSSLTKEMAYKCVKLATEMGYSAKSQPLPILNGATDAINGVDAGIKACTLMSVDLEKRVNNTFYHTDEDTVDKIENNAVEQAISIAIKLANDLDNNNTEDLLNEEKMEEEEPDILDLIKFNKISRR